MPKTQCPHGDGTGEPCIRCAMEEVPVLPIHLHLILDVSPSMVGRWAQTLSGLNEYMDSLRKDQADNDQPYKVSMTTFSEKISHPYTEVELDSIPTFTTKNLSPNGWGTALYEAVGPTIKAISTSEPVLVVIITDGEENSSKTWDEDKVAELMDSRQKLGNYTYAYLGVAKEAWGNAAKMGSAVARSVNNIQAHEYNAGTYSKGDSSLASCTVAYSSMLRSARAAGRSMSVNNFFDPSSDEEMPVVSSVK